MVWAGSPSGLPKTASRDVTDETCIGFEQTPDPLLAQESLSTRGVLQVSAGSSSHFQQIYTATEKVIGQVVGVSYDRLFAHEEEQNRLIRHLEIVAEAVGRMTLVFRDAPAAWLRGTP
jgi:hypothetical protein